MCFNVESSFLKGHYFLHEHSLFDRLHFCQPMEFLVTDVRLQRLLLGLVLAAQPAVGLYLALQRALFLVGTAVLVLRGRRMVMVAVDGGDSAPEILSIWVVVVPQMVLEIPAGSAVLLVTYDRLFFCLFYLMTFVLLELFERQFLQGVE